MNKRLNWLLVLFLLAGLTTLVACGSADPTEPAPDDVEPPQMAEGELKTLYVGPELVDCVGVGPMQCMQVRENPADPYTLFYQQIEGFTFEPGFEYELLVRVITVENPPADGSSLRYTLVSVVNQTPMADSALPPSTTDSTPVVPATAADELPLVGTLWQMQSHQGNDALPGTEVTAVFAADGSLSGNSGCNNFSTSYTVDGNSLTVNDAIAATMMACLQEGVMEQETAFLAALTDAATFEIRGNSLEIRDAEGGVLVSFVAVTPAALTSVTWQLTSYNNGREAVVSVLTGTEITAVFGEDGSLAGSAGCNRFTTSFQADSGSISIGLVASTMMACEEEIMQQETAFLAALPTAATYDIQGDTLELRDANGALVASFVAQTPPSLTGVNWQLTDVNINNGIVVAVGEATAVFGEDGSLSGSTGCNNYRTTFTQDGSALTISPEIISTRMACPDGAISEQEAAFLAALPQTATYQMDGDRLELRDANGALLAAFGLAAATELPGSSWLVTGYYVNQAIVSPAIGSELAIYFDPGNTVEGSAGCNRFFGPFQVADSNLTIGALATTFAFCAEPEGIMEQEAAFLAALQSAATYSIQGKLLEIRSADGAIAIQAIPAEQ